MSSGGGGGDVPGEASREASALSSKPAVQRSLSHPLTGAVLDFLLDAVLASSNFQPAKARGQGGAKSSTRGGAAHPLSQPPLPLSTMPGPLPASTAFSSMSLSSPSPPSSSLSSSSSSPPAISAATMTWLCPMLGAAISRNRHVLGDTACLRLVGRLVRDGALDVALAGVTEGLPPPPSSSSLSSSHDRPRQDGGSRADGFKSTTPLSGGQDARPGGAGPRGDGRYRREVTPPQNSAPPPPGPLDAPPYYYSQREGPAGHLVLLLCCCGWGMQQKVLLLSATQPPSLLPLPFPPPPWDTPLGSRSVPPIGPSAATPSSSSPSNAPPMTAMTGGSTISRAARNPASWAQQLAAAILHVLAGADHEAIARADADAARVADEAAARASAVSSSQSGGLPMVGGGSGSSLIVDVPPSTAPSQVVNPSADAISVEALKSHPIDVGDSLLGPSQDVGPRSSATPSPSDVQGTEQMRAYLEAEGFSPSAAALISRRQRPPPVGPDAGLPGAASASATGANGPSPTTAAQRRQSHTSGGGPNLAAEAELSEVALRDFSTHPLVLGRGLPALLLELYDHCTRRHGMVVRLDQPGGRAVAVKVLLSMILCGRDSEVGGRGGEWTGRGRRGGRCGMRRR